MAIIKNPLILIKKSSGGASLNIEYGNSAPSNTSKLWVKTSEPGEIEINSNYEIQVPNEIDERGNLHTGTYNSACGIVGTKCYIFGGVDSSNTYLNIIQIYDIETKQTTLSNATLPYQMGSMACGVVGTKIYLFGGRGANTGGTQNYVNLIQVYDTLTDSIATLPIQFGNYTGMACGVIGNKIYLFGGQYPSGQYNTGYSSAIRVFDTTNEQYSLTNLSVSLPEGITGMVCSVVGTKIYLFGGVSKTRIFEFETETTYTLTQIPDITITAFNCPCQAIGTNIYIFYQTTIKLFDTLSNTLTNLTVTSPFSFMYTSSVVNNNEIIIFSNHTGSTPQISSFLVSLSLTENKMLLIYDIFAKFNIINTDTIKVKINPIDCYKGDSNNIGQQVKIALYNETQQDWVEIN